MINSRERNRMHAKMTRDRKKLFISSVEKTIAELEQNNKRMRSILAKQAVDHAKVAVTCTSTPSCSTPALISSNSSTASVLVPPMSPSPVHSLSDVSTTPSATHGFTAIA